MTAALWPDHDPRWKQLEAKERAKSTRLAKSQRLEPYLLNLWRKAKAGTPAEMKRIKRSMSALKRQVYDGKPFIKSWEVCDLVREGCEVVNRPTAASAKYAVKLMGEDVGFEVKFQDLTAKKVGEAVPNKAFAQTAERRRIPFAKPGQLIAVDGQIGWILDFNGDANLDVWMAESGRVENCHPNWKAVYFDDSFVEIITDA